MLLGIFHLPGKALEMMGLSVVGEKLVSLFHKSVGVVLIRSLLITGIAYYLLCSFFSNQPCFQSPELFTSLRQGRRPDSSNDLSTATTTTTNISHIVFGMTGSTNTWRSRRHYIEEWWQPNITRGVVWLNRIPTEFLPWPPSSPPYRVSGDVGAFKDYDNHGMRDAVRATRLVMETYREFNDSVRWYVLVDDDTLVVVENLVEVLAGYDHNKYYYIGGNSESISSNDDNAFDLAFGGAGSALSYPLVKSLVIHLDECIKRYPNLYGSDHVLQSCIIELGVSLTHERGFHQIDLKREIWGFLSAHPQVPLLTLHHIDVVEPIFPSMDRRQSVEHFMKAARLDSSRLLQQTICYHKQSNWSFSISWGYSAQIYEKIYPPSLLQRPLQTFIPWTYSARPSFMFNTRPLSNDPCEAPHVFFRSVETTASRTEVVTTYTRSWPRNLSTCSSTGNHSADSISEIRVFSPMKRFSSVGRRECCDIVRFHGFNITEVRIRGCRDDEIVA